jgi:general stress protein 26
MEIHQKDQLMMLPRSSKMKQQKKGTSDVKLLGEKIKGIHVAMLTTVEPDGTLRSRPMVTQDTEFDGDLWFFTQASAPKVEEVQQHQQVNVSYEKPSEDLFISVSGTAQLVRDRNEIRKQWRPHYKTWFPKGEDDPDLALLKVAVTRAEYWHIPLGGGLSSLFRGHTPQLAETDGVDVKLNIRH